MTDSLEDIDRAHLLHPLVPFTAHEKRGPNLVTGGEGIRIFTDNGGTLIDGLSGLFNINVGHGRTEIADAVAEQMRTQAYYPSFWGYSVGAPIKLAERLAGLMPDYSDMDHFLFATGGSDSNELNFRFARLYHAVQGRKERRKILSRRGAYHGMLRASGSATRLPAYHVMDEPDPLHIETDTAYCFRCKYNKTFPGCELACADDVEAVIAREGADTIAAIIAEPVQGTGGIIIPPEGYFDKLSAICKKHDILLILDEVITGFGRTGKWFGMEHWNVKPDLMTMAKGITSGYLPLGACGMSKRVYEVIRDQSPKGFPFMGGLTYNNHPAPCAAALANLDIVEREGLVDNARDVGAYLLSCLKESFGNDPLAGEIRGIGMLSAIEFSKPGTNEHVGEHAGGFPAKIARACLGKGLIVRAMWECIAVAPPLITTKQDVDEIVGKLLEGYNEVAPQFR